MNLARTGAGSAAFCPSTQLSTFVQSQPVANPGFNTVRFEGVGGCVEHGWWPLQRRGGFMTVSKPGSICLTFSRHPKCEAFTGGRASFRSVEPGCVGIAGPEPITWCAVDEPSETVELVATPEFRASIADEMGVGADSGMADLHGGTDPVVWAIAAQARSALRSAEGLQGLECEALLWHVYRHVFAARFGGRARSKGEGKLDARRRERIVEFIEAHLHDPGLTIDALAGVAALSRFHFIRAFERTLRMPPHRYVRARRLERIRELIAHGVEPSLAAAHYGLTHGRHFRAAYHRHHGLAPGESVAEMLVLSP